jgi:signal transduction histidine kinase
MTDSLHRECRQLAGSLDRAMGEVRSVLHVLRPALLEEQGLVAALDNEVRTRCVDADLADVLLELDEGGLGLRWPAEVEYAAFMIAREAIVDAQHRSGCTLVRVVLSGDAHSLQLEVIDDGRPALSPLPHAPLGHLGLVGMRERAVAIGARFEVQYDPNCGQSVILLWLKGAQ